MVSCIHDFYQNLLLVWSYGASSPLGQTSWSKRNIEIVPTRLVPPANRRPIFQRFLDVLQRVCEISSNTFTSISLTEFQLAKRILDGHEIHPSVVFWPTFNRNHLFVTDPNYFQAILSHERNETGDEGLFSGGDPIRISKRILGDNFLSYDSEKHPKMRRIAALFLKTNWTHLPILQQSIDETLKAWIDSGKSEPYNFLPNLVISSICRCFFGWYEDTRPITNSVEILLIRAYDRTSKEYEDATATLEDYAYKIQSSRNLPTLQGLTENELITFIKFMFFAGQDSTSAFLEYLIFILGDTEDHRKMQEKLYDEWKLSTLDLHTFTSKSSLLRNIILEGLRLHPPFFEQTREALQSLVIDGKYAIPKGTLIHLNHIYSQRDQRRWGSLSDEFNPGRFENSEELPAMCPFSMGPTSCLGKQLAIQLSKLFIMTLVSKFRWETLSTLKKISGPIATKIHPDVSVSISKRDS